MRAGAFSQGKGASALLYDARIEVATAPVPASGPDGLPRDRAAIDAEVRGQLVWASSTAPAPSRREEKTTNRGARFRQKSL